MDFVLYGGSFQILRYFCMYRPKRIFNMVRWMVRREEKWRGRRYVTKQGTDLLPDLIGP